VFNGDLSNVFCRIEFNVFFYDEKTHSLHSFLQVHMLQQKLTSVTANMKFLKANQVIALERRAEAESSGIVWLTETVRVAFQMRFLTGVHGYQFIRSLGYTLPSYITLCNRVPHAEFHPGVQTDILLGYLTKLKYTKPKEGRCSFVG
jgi:hypothetical protein